MASHDSQPIARAEFYGDIYEVLDTSLVDQAALNEQASGLHEAAETAEDRLAANALINEVGQRIEARREYALRRVLGRAASDIAAGTHEASLAYVAGFEDPEAQVAAAGRVAVYNFLIRNTWRTGNPISADETALASAHAASQRPVRVYGTHDPETGKVWVRITDPRVVEAQGMGAREEQVVERYPIVSQSVDDQGRTVVVVGGGGISERAFTIPSDSRALRVSHHGDTKVLELFIPAGSVSLGEAAIHEEGGQLDRVHNDLALSVAARAAGATRPSIFDTLQRPSGNPHPIPVAKTQ